jgi:menaquinone-9 beta-reductase
LRLGVSLEGCETGSFHGIKFVGPENSVAAEFPQGRGLGIRRVLLHQFLLEQAQTCGAEMLWGARVSAIREDGVLVNGKAITCRWIVGADGQNSRVRDWAGLSAGSGRKGSDCASIFGCVPGVNTLKSTGAARDRHT